MTKKKLRIGIIDIVAKGPSRALFARLMYANLASIMPQVVGAGVRQQGTTSITSATPARRICAASCRTRSTCCSSVRLPRPRSWPMP